MLSDLCIFRNIEDSNMICNQNTEYFKVIVTIFYQNQMNLNMSQPTDTSILRYESCLLVNICLFFQERIKAR